MNKSQYRDIFQELKSHIKLGVFCDDCGIPRNTLSVFLHGADGVISLEKLSQLYEAIASYMQF